MPAQFDNLVRRYVDTVTKSGNCWSADLDPDPQCQLYVCQYSLDGCELVVERPNKPDDEYSLTCGDSTKGYKVCPSDQELWVCH